MNPLDRPTWRKGGVILSDRFPARAAVFVWLTEDTLTFIAPDVKTDPYMGSHHIHYLNISNVNGKGDEIMFDTKNWGRCCLAPGMPDREWQAYQEAIRDDDPEELERMYMHAVKPYEPDCLARCRNGYG